MTLFSNFPALSSQQFQHLHRLMQAQGTSVSQRLEASGARVTELAARLLAEDLAEDEVSNSAPTTSFDQVADQSIVVLTGGGDSGAVGLIAARHLAEHDAWVQVLTLIPSDKHTGHAADALNALLAADVPLAWADEGWELPPCDLLIDALTGLDTVGLDTDGLEVATDTLEAVDTVAKRKLIELANSSLAPILSIGSPSRVDSNQVDSNQAAPNQAAPLLVQASATLALGYPHLCLQNPIVHAASGDLYLADIGIPHSLLQKLDLASTVNLAPLFSSGPIIRL